MGHASTNIFAFAPLLILLAPMLDAGKQLACLDLNVMLKRCRKRVNRHLALPCLHTQVATRGECHTPDGCGTTATTITHQLAAGLLDIRLCGLDECNTQLGPLLIHQLVVSFLYLCEGRQQRLAQVSTAEHSGSATQRHSTDRGRLCPHGDQMTCPGEPTQTAAAQHRATSATGVSANHKPTHGFTCSRHVTHLAISVLDFVLCGVGGEHEDLKGVQVNPLVVALQDPFCKANNAASATYTTAAFSLHNHTHRSETRAFRGLRVAACSSPSSGSTSSAPPLLPSRTAPPSPNLPGSCLQARQPLPLHRCHYRRPRPWLSRPRRVLAWTPGSEPCERLPLQPRARRSLGRAAGLRERQETNACGVSPCSNMHGASVQGVQRDANVRTYRRCTWTGTRRNALTRTERRRHASTPSASPA